MEHRKGYKKPLEPMFKDVELIIWFPCLWASLSLGRSGNLVITL